MRERLYRLLVSTPPRVAFARPWPGTRRGLVLWLLCWAIILVGAANYIGTDLPPRTRDALEPVLTLMSATGWGYVFVTVGVVSGFLAYCHFDRDHIGYALMTGLTGGWAVVWLLGFIFDWLDDGVADWRIVSGSVIWLAFAAVLFTCRGFDKTPLPRRHGKPGDR